LLWRLGFQSSITANLVEGYGYQGSGKMGDSNGSVAHVRREMDQGEYRHVGALSMDDVTKISSDEFALARIQKANESFRTPELLETMRVLG
jgi:pantothenate kinase-related protein Tda10